MDGRAQVNVREMIEKLQEMDPDLEVLEFNRDYGYDVVEEIEMWERTGVRHPFYPQVGTKYVVINPH